jgi:hypothetical protein
MIMMAWMFIYAYILRGITRTYVVPKASYGQEIFCQKLAEKRKIKLIENFPSVLVDNFNLYLMAFTASKNS